jgi:hypothetical protein
MGSSFETFRTSFSSPQVESVSRITLSKIVALGHTRTEFPMLAHTLPPSAGVDGVLGLDFLRGQTLTIDFGNGQINLI